MKALIVIPARLQSTRLPRKLLLKETGMTVLEHTYRSASKSKLADAVVVAADHEELFDVVAEFGGQVEMTSPTHQSGTDRVAEVAQRHQEYDIVVNVQGDEPEIPGADIDMAIQMLVDDPGAVVATLATPIGDEELLRDPACVKVVLDHNYRALYFSRSPIPCPKVWDDSLLSSTPPSFFQHIGLYAYRREFLLQYSALQASVLEEIESLEQLRILQAGEAISVGLTAKAIVGIDTAKDYELFVSRQQKC